MEINVREELKIKINLRTKVEIFISTYDVQSCRGCWLRLTTMACDVRRAARWMHLALPRKPRQQLHRCGGALCCSLHAVSPTLPPAVSVLYSNRAVLSLPTMKLLGPDLQNILRFVIRLSEVCRKIDLR